MNLEQKIKQQLGELMFNLNYLQVELEKAKAELETLKKEKDESARKE